MSLGVYFLCNFLEESVSLFSIMLHYSHRVKDREVWRAIFHGVTKSQTQLNDQTTTIHTGQVNAGGLDFV